MKTKDLFLSLLVLILTAGALTGCSKDDEGNDNTPSGSKNTNLIVGTWKYSYGDGGYIELTLNESGTGRFFEYSADGEIEEDFLTWTFDGRTLHLNYSDGTHEEWTITHITEQQMIEEDGSIWIRCSKDDNGSETSPLVGTWKHAYRDGGYIELTLNESGAGRFFEYSADGEIEEDFLTWTFDGRTLHLNYSDGTHEEWTITHITEQQMIEEDGSIWIKIS